MKIQKDKTNQADKLLLGSNAADKEFYDSSKKKEEPKPEAEEKPEENEDSAKNPAEA